MTLKQKAIRFMKKHDMQLIIAFIVLAHVAVGTVEFMKF